MFFITCLGQKMKWLKLMFLSFLISIIFSSECFSQMKKLSKKSNKSFLFIKKTDFGRSIYREKADPLFGEVIDLKKNDKVKKGLETIQDQTVQGKAIDFFLSTENAFIFSKENLRGIDWVAERQHMFNFI